MNEIEFFSEQEALEEAREISENYFDVIHVIQSNEIYYIDLGGITEEWEVLIATFAFGEQIKGKEVDFYTIRQGKGDQESIANNIDSVKID